MSSARMRNIIGEAFCAARGTDTADLATIKVLASYATEYGSKRVKGWLDDAVSRLNPCVSDRRIGRYVSGIRRSWLEERGK